VGSKGNNFEWRKEGEKKELSISNTKRFELTSKFVTSDSPMTETLLFLPPFLL